MASSTLARKPLVLAGLENLVSMAKTVALRHLCIFKETKHAVMIIHPEDARLRYVVGDGIENDELTLLIEIFRQNECLPCSVWVPYSDREIGDSMNTICQKQYGYSIIRNKRNFKRELKTMFNAMPANGDICYFIEDESDIHRVIRLFDKSKNEIGSVTLYNDNETIGVYDLKINEPYRRKGYGRILIDLIEQTIQHPNTTKIVAQVKDNVLAFYTKVGFEVEGKLCVMNIV